MATNLFSRNAFQAAIENASYVSRDSARKIADDWATSRPLSEGFTWRVRKNRRGTYDVKAMCPGM